MRTSSPEQGEKQSRYGNINCLIINKMIVFLKLVWFEEKDLKECEIKVDRKNLVSIMRTSSLQSERSLKT
jgi:hypothetical protein